MNDNIIIFEDCKFLWSKEKLNEIKTLWKKGYKPEPISKIIKESLVDTWLAINYLVYEEEIEFGR